MPDLTIHAATRDDIEAVKQLALVNRMFGADELGLFDETIAGSLDGTHAGHRWTVAVTDGHLVGAAYVAPEPFGDRVWNLFFIATAPETHGGGVGTALVGDVERHLARLGSDAASVLIVETSGTDQYQRARRFYAARGFDRESRIRDFYGPGDDKVTFWKALNR